MSIPLSVLRTPQPSLLDQVLAILRRDPALAWSVTELLLEGRKDVVDPLHPELGAIGFSLEAVVALLSNPHALKVLQFTLDEGVRWGTISVLPWLGIPHYFAATIAPKPAL